MPLLAPVTTAVFRMKHILPTVPTPEDSATEEQAALVDGSF
jgi:hypothetical protein